MKFFAKIGFLKKFVGGKKHPVKGLRLIRTEGNEVIATDTFRAIVIETEENYKGVTYVNPHTKEEEEVAEYPAEGVRKLFAEAEAGEKKIRLVLDAKLLAEILTSLNKYTLNRHIIIEQTAKHKPILIRPKEIKENIDGVQNIKAILMPVADPE